MSMKNFVNMFFCHFLFRVSYDGLENLELYPKYLVCPNHSNIFDPFFIYPKTSNLYIMAKSELFGHKLFGKLLKRYNVFPVNRNTKDPGSLLYSMEIFKTDTPTQLLIFTEGGVVKYEKDIGKKVKNGATFISANLDIPIIPAYITRRPRLFSKVHVTFGKPIFNNKEILKNKSDLRSASMELVNKIYSLK